MIGLKRFAIKKIVDLSKMVQYTALRNVITNVFHSLIIIPEISIYYKSLVSKIKCYIEIF